MKIYMIYLQSTHTVNYKELFKEAKTKDEQDFYMALSNIVLQKQQSKVIGK